MKIKKLIWAECEKLHAGVMQKGLYTIAYHSDTETWEYLYIFPDIFGATLFLGGSRENNKISQHSSVDNAKVGAQILHEQSVIQDFMEEE